MTKTVEFIFDIVSPNAYLAWYPLRAMLARHDAVLEVTPVFLGGMHKLTGNAPPFQRDAEVKGKNAYAMIEMQRFIARHELTRFAMHPQFPFNSVTLQRMLLAVEGDARIALVEALLQAVWERGVPLEDIGPVLAETGFDPQALMAATQDPAIKQQLVDNTDRAVERGAFGIPTFFVDGDMYFGKERLAQIDEQLAAD